MKAANWINKRRPALMTIGLALLSSVNAHSAFIPLGGTNYFQDFDSLVSSGKSSTLPVGWAMFYPTDSKGSIFADNGSGTAGRIYSYGANGSTDRALGSLRDPTLKGSQSPMFGASFQNTSGAAFNRLNI